MEIVIGVLTGIGLIVIIGLILVLFTQKSILKEYQQRDEKMNQTIDEVEKELKQFVNAYAGFIVLLDKEKYLNLNINKDNIKLAQEFVALNRVIFEYKDKSYSYQEFRKYRDVPTKFQFLAKDIEEKVPTPNSAEEIAILIKAELSRYSGNKRGNQINKYSQKQTDESIEELL